ncbi:sarcosine oxidase subunit delta [Alphaproteobacteria bacterium]|nr:sarcosine oxidase subunit delta [Alphaproteobacteria bacterium]
MIIEHPLLGPRDSSEFVYMGDASLINRPKWDEEEAEDKFYEYLYLRKNIAGIHNELWFHQQGDRSWLVISRNTLTHEIIKVDLATDFSKKHAKQQ